MAGPPHRGEGQENRFRPDPPEDQSPLLTYRGRPGEVLVCPITTAAWMMTFQRAGALVADAGSVLSHTAIVAREYGLPAVVATSNGTSTLVDGEEVTVDGNRGTVERVAAASARSDLSLS